MSESCPSGEGGGRWNLGWDIYEGYLVPFETSGLS